ncbi:hypothetical protein THMIRHAM_12920 [Thiomicrorhabdus immobilis]|uniref:Diguanylate cyclase n=1 Tax=Thiomicrorhabdus immobilis TaxID=2791037 RepID=A0ABM7MDK9_9GAMM|nr:EAL domain-containing protein [Thiomicrorhabdus immobilis]BCN93507.1 hypothetical protein THMIRHAM_12920 [Thiomicrorhabdus immobilis]
MSALAVSQIMTSQVTTVAKDTCMADVMHLMQKNRISSIVIVENEKPIGIFTERDAILLVQQKPNLQQISVESQMSSHLFCVTQDMSYLEAYELLSNRGLRHLVIVDELGKLAGIISESDFLKNIGTEYLIQFKEVGSLMNARVLMLEPDDTVIDAINLMSEQQISSVVIQENGIPIGIYTERDVVNLDEHYDEVFSSPLKEVMSSPVSTIFVNASVSDAIKQMDQKQVRRLVVVDHTKNAVGLLSRHEVVESLRSSQIEFLQQQLQKKNLTVNVLEKELERERRANQLQRLLSETQRIAKIGSWEFNHRTQELYWSKEVFNIFNCDQKHFKPSFENFLDLVHPDDRASVEQEYQNAISTGSIYELTHRLLLNNGSIKYVKERGETSFDETGLPIKTIGTVQDITAQKMAENHLQHTSQDLTRAQKIAKLGNWSYEVSTQKIVWSEELFRIFGQPVKDFLDYPTLISWLHPADRESHDQYMQNLLDLKPNEELGFFQYRLVHPNGDIRWVNVAVEAEFNQQGEPVYFFGTVQDITEQQQKEAQLQQYASIFDNLAEGILITDTANKILNVNAAFTRITGYSLDEVIGQTPNLLQSGLHDSSFYQQMWQELSLKGQWQGEVLNRRKDGSFYHEWLAVSSIKNSKGEVLNYVAVFTDISSIKKTEEELRFMAHHDALTKLPNRLLLEERLSHSLERSNRSHTSTAILFIDLDRFKEINDSFGHPVGDQLLIEVASRLKQTTRKQDTVARVSGDEFVVILEDIKNIPVITQIAQSILERLSAPLSIDIHNFRVTTSIGIAISPDDGTQSVDLLKKADTALYRAKEQGRNNYEFFSEEMATANFELMYLNSALRKALENEEFVLYYQPQVNSLTGKIVGTEALVRWLSPDTGLVAPNRFIPLTEDTGLIVPLGAWILKKACLQMKTWLSEGIELSHIAVNISGRQLSDKNIVRTVRDALNFSGLDARYLELEITESTIMQEDRYISVLHEFKALGIRLSIDDFGTGYSSLSRLKHMPIDKLKIDQSFIKGVPGNKDDEMITQTVIGLAQNFGLEILAEGVETQEQLEFLKQNNCHYIQGYFFSKPLPFNEIDFSKR